MINIEVPVQGSKVYTVKFGDLSKAEVTRQGCERGWSCTCPAFYTRKSATRMCKHIESVKASMGLPSELTGSQKAAIDRLLSAEQIAAAAATQTPPSRGKVVAPSVIPNRDAVRALSLDEDDL